MNKVTPIQSPEVVSQYVEKALKEKDPTGLPLAFRMDVLGKYREAGYTIYRTRTAGRVQSPEGWRLDFGIVDGAGVIHATVRDVLKLPRREREHLAAHVVTAPLNARYLKIQMGHGGCVDEGDIVPWDGRPWEHVD